MKKFEILLCSIVLLSGLFLRLYKIDRPVADWHSWRQADTAAVARNFAKGKIDLLYPQQDNLLILNEKGLPNPNRYFINEFPAYNAIVAVFYKLFGINTQIARGVSVAFSIVGMFFLYLIAKKLFNIKIAIIALAFYAFNPYDIFYSSVIMPDPTFIALSIITLYVTLKWVEERSWIFAILLTFSFSSAMLVKPYAVFLAIPVAYWLILNWRMQAITSLQPYFVALISITPLILWRIHVNNHPEGSFASTWLLNAGAIRFTGSFFRWIIFERLNKVIFATGGFVLFIVGVIRSYQQKNSSFIFVWLISVLLYITIFAKGNVTHDYYQLPIAPVGAILVSLGFFALINLAREVKYKIFNGLISLFLLLISFAFGWYEVRGYFNINNPAIVEAGKRVDQIVPKDSLVVADYGGDPAFLYQTNRYGYSAVERALSDYPKIGVNYFISVKPEDEGIKKLVNNCNWVDKSPDFVIIRLDSCSQID